MLFCFVFSLVQLLLLFSIHSIPFSLYLIFQANYNVSDNLAHQHHHPNNGHSNAINSHHHHHSNSSNGLSLRRHDLRLSIQGDSNFVTSPTAGALTIHRRSEQVSVDPATTVPFSQAAADQASNPLHFGMDSSAIFRGASPPSSLPMAHAPSTGTSVIDNPVDLSNGKLAAHNHHHHQQQQQQQSQHMHRLQLKEEILFDPEQFFSSPQLPHLQQQQAPSSHLLASMSQLPQHLLSSSHLHPAHHHHLRQQHHQHQQQQQANSVITSAVTVGIPDQSHGKLITLFHIEKSLFFVCLFKTDLKIGNLELVFPQILFLIYPHSLLLSLFCFIFYQPFT